MGTALLDVSKALITCKLIDIAERLTKFIDDLLDCIEGDCVNFIIDFFEEIIIMYQDRYEIYGDIRGSINSFNHLKAYQQGGLCIGRMVKACLNIKEEEENLYNTGQPMKVIEP